MPRKKKEINVYTPAEAVKYLAEERGIHLSVTALRMRRNRNKAHAAHVASRISIWTQDELNTLEVPKGARNKPKEKRKEPHEPTP